MTNEGSTFNDLLSVGRDLVLSNSTTIEIDSLSGVLSPNAYTIINYAGPLVGNTANLTVTSPNTRYNLALDFSVAGKVRVIVTSGGPKSLTWYGNFFGDPDNWDVQVAPTWGGEVFYQGDLVSFDETGASLEVNLIGSLLPGSINVSGDPKSYTFVGQ